MGYVGCNEYVANLAEHNVKQIVDMANDMNIPIEILKINDNIYQVFSNTVKNARQLLEAFNKDTHGN